MSTLLGCNQRPYFTLLLGISSGAIATICLNSILPDVGYSFRMFLIDYFSESKQSSKSKSCEYMTRVRPSQIDRSGHMNNSMYLYELNFSRRKFFSALGLWRQLKERNANMVIQAQTIRYRRELRVWQEYSIVSRIVQFSETESCFYLESRFVTPDGFVAAVHHVKYRVVGEKGLDGKPTKISPRALLISADVLPHNMALDEMSPLESTRGSDSEDLDQQFVGLWEAANTLSSRALNPNKKV